MGRPWEPPDPQVKNGAAMHEGLQGDRRGMWKVEDDSFTKTGHGAGGAGGTGVGSDSVRELGSSSPADLRLLDVVMKTNYRVIHSLLSGATCYCWETLEKLQQTLQSKVMERS